DRSESCARGPARRMRTAAAAAVPCGLARRPGGDGPIARRRTPTSTHWGNYDVEVRGDEVVALHPVADDPDPSPIGIGMPRAQNHAGRILRPAVRRGWLEGDGGAARG